MKVKIDFKANLGLKKANLATEKGLLEKSGSPIKGFVKKKNTCPSEYGLQNPVTPWPVVLQLGSYDPFAPASSTVRLTISLCRFAPVTHLD